MFGKLTSRKYMLYMFNSDGLNEILDKIRGGARLICNLIQKKTIEQYM